MEWDQYLFYSGSKLIRKIQNRIRKERNYYRFHFSEHQPNLNRLSQIVSKPTLNLRSSKDRFSIGPSHIEIREELRLLKKREASESLLKIYFVYLTYRRNKYEMYKHSINNKNLHQIGFIKSYPGLISELRILKKEFMNLEKENRKHFLYLKNVFLRVNYIDFGKTLGSENPKDYKSDRENNPNGQRPLESKVKKNLDTLEIREVDQKKIDEYTPGHSFEKIDTLEEFDGQWRDIDAEEDMQEEEALNEVKLRQLIRTEDPVHRTLNMEIGQSVGSEFKDFQAEKDFRYPEWDFKKKQYKLDFCSLREEEVSEGKEGEVYEIIKKNHRVIFELQKELGILMQKKVKKVGLNQGSEIDFDRLVHFYADLRANKTPSEKIYFKKLPKLPEISIYFLLDLSLSTDSWIQGKQILQLEKETRIVFCEALDGLSIQFAISGFYSRTRNHCRYLPIKEFREDWQITKGRIGNLSSMGYTRIGPALRHRLVKFEKNHSEQKWIILLTDPRPNDYDKYEGRYGIQDVNQAVKECKNRGIRIHTLAIGTHERATIPEMMQEASYKMLFSPNRLQDALEGFFLRAIGRS
jgi:nitric oxide reductase NorD protein